VTPSSKPPESAAKARLQVTYSRLPLSFEANQGQTDEQVNFLSRGRGYTLFLTSSEAVLALRNGERGIQNDELKNPHSAFSDHHSSFDSGPVLRMKLVGANVNPQVAGLEELPGKVNYFRGNDPQKWRTDIPTYAKVKYQDVYPGVDLAYYGNQGQLEYDFVVTPGADPNVIRLGFADVVRATGRSPLQINDNGDLVLLTGSGEVRLLKPQIYQEIDGAKHSIAGHYVLLDPKTQDSELRTYKVGFEMAAYDTSKPLVIDPVLSYSTYLGGSGQDQGSRIAVDDPGNIYVTGFACSSDFPVENPFQTTSGNCDVFVTKVDPTGTMLVYSTYLGGNGDDYGHDLALDSSGSVYVTGATRSTDFPTQNPFQATSGGCSGVLVTGGGCDAFVTKLNPTGSALVYSTYLGGSGTDAASGIAVDSSGNAYVAGTGSPNNFPTTPGAFQDLPGGSVFITKVNSTGSALVYSGFLGGREGTDIAVDSYGNAYVTGQVGSHNFPTVNPFQATFGGGILDAYVAKLNPEGTALVYSTYLGGNGEDQGLGIALDPSGNGNVYITGFTASTDFPTVNPFQATFGGIADAFVAKISENLCAVTVGSIAAPVNPVQVNTTVNASADFTDSDPLNTHTAVWDWGDNSTSPGVVDEIAGSVSRSHTYTTAGVYTITLTVTNQGGCSGQSIFQFVVVYDPNAGFVTGGGWINSPAGAYAPNPALTGKATFGFVSKYQKGATVPTGQTEFQFQVANLNFHSTSYQWLVVAGPHAQYKGSGTINGSGDYGFLLTARDGQANGGGGVDKFRIKIWDKTNNGGLVYDNQMNDPDDAEATTALGGGSIVIHK
jgi:hypothetical protein